MKCDEMNCAEIKQLFSPYLDGRVSGSEMRALTRHVEVVHGLRAGICRDAAHATVAGQSGSSRRPRRTWR